MEKTHDGGTNRGPECKLNGRSFLSKQYYKHSLPRPYGWGFLLEKQMPSLEKQFAKLLGEIIGKRWVARNQKTYQGKTIEARTDKPENGRYKPIHTKESI